MPYENIPMPCLSGTGGAVASAQYLATKAGLEVLADGGNAIDAAIAVSLSLSVVEPYHSGIGGGCFALIHSSKTGETIAIDARGTAPYKACRDLFIDNGKVREDWIAYTGKGVAVPGLVKTLEVMWEKYGTKDFGELSQAAIQYAREGYPMSPFLANVCKDSGVAERFRRYPALKKTFMPAGEPAIGQLIKQENLARTIEKITKDGAEAYYKGAIADAIVKEVNAHGGIFTREDLSGYQPRLTEPVRGKYRGYEIVSMSPPSSGGTFLIQMLNILENYDLRQAGHNSSDTIHLLAETMKIAFADRSVGIGDPEFVKVNLKKLLSKEYAKSRYNSIDMAKAAGYTPDPGVYTTHLGATSHFAVLDKFGNAVSLTQTVRDWFGSGVYVEDTGFVMNNEMADASPMLGVATAFQGLAYGKANSIEGGKRPLSSMTPTIVLKDNKPVMAIGAAGGPRIITATLQAILNVLDFGMPVNMAVNAPRIHCQGQNLELEHFITRDTQEKLAAKGHTLAVLPGNEAMLCYANGVMCRDGLFFGGAEPRVEGVAGCVLDGNLVYNGPISVPNGKK